MKKSLSSMKIAASLIGTQLGGGVIIATTESGYKYGIYGIFYSLGIALGLLCLAFIANSKIYPSNIMTSVTIFETSYNSKGLRYITSVLSIVSLVFILLAQLSGLRGMFVAMDINLIFFYIIALALIIYSVEGGIFLVATVNQFQIGAIFLIFGFIFFNLFHRFEVFQMLMQSTNNSAFYKSIDYSHIVIPFLFCLIEQDMVQKIFVAEDRKSARVASIVSAIALVIFSLVPIIIGILAKQNGLEQSSSILIDFTKNSLGPVMFYIMVVAIVLAILSTADSLICAIHSNITHDFPNKWVKPIMYMILLSALLSSAHAKDILLIFISSYKIVIYTSFIPIMVNNYIDNIFYKRQLAYTMFLIGSLGFIYEAFFNSFIVFYVISVQLLVFILYKFEINKRF